MEAKIEFEAGVLTYIKKLDNNNFIINFTNEFIIKDHDEAKKIASYMRYCACYVDSLGELMKKENKK